MTTHPARCAPARSPSLKESRLLRQRPSSLGLRRGNYSVIRVGELQFVEPRVRAALREKLLVRACLGDETVLEHYDLVRAADRGKPVRDDECRAPRHQIRKSSLHEH